MIDTAVLGFAIGAGLVAALNPCGFVLLPGYLGLMIADGSAGSSRPVALARAGLATVAMSAGFLTVFGIFGLLISPVVASAHEYLPFATVVIGVVLVVLAVWLLAGKDITLIMPKPSAEAPTRRLPSMYGYGVGYATASMCCTVAPFLSVISATFKQGSLLSGVLAFISYAAGMTITVGVAALAVALAGAAAADTLRRVLPYVGRIAGVVALFTGLYVAYYGYYKIGLDSTDASPDDPIVNTVGTVQAWLVGQINTLGVWPLLAALAVLAASALGWRIVARRRAGRS